MDISLSKQTRIITGLIFLTLLLPIVGFYGAAYIEVYYYEPFWAAVLWTVLVLFASFALWCAHQLAYRSFQFGALKFLSFSLTLAAIGSIGWVSNNAWYDYDTFSGFVYPDYQVRQSTEVPNQFLFDGPIVDGAERMIMMRILGADNVDWDKPIVLEVSSEGGNPKEAIIIGEFVKQYGIHTEAVGDCISACGIILLSSHSRYIHPRAWVGFHATYLDNTNEDERYDSPSLKFYDDWMQNRLKELGVSKAFRENALVRDITGGYFPSYEVLRNEGIINQSSRLYRPEDKPPSYL
jgi:hypothetical protein